MTSLSVQAHIGYLRMIFRTFPTREFLIFLVLLSAVLTTACGGGEEPAPVPVQSTPAPDTTSPSVTITTSAPVLQNNTNATPIPITVTFTEVVTGFDLTDLVVVNGGKGNPGGSGNIYTFDITPVGDPASITIDIPGGAGQDAAGNPNLPAPAFAITYISIFNPLDNPPTISNINDKATNQDTTLEFVLFTADEGPDPAEDPQILSVTSTTSSDQGLVQDANITSTFTDNGDGGSGELTIVPEPGQIGTVTITVTVTDGNSTVSDSFNVTIHAVVSPPTAFPINASTAQNTPIAFALAASDPLSEPIVSWTMDTQPLNGTLSGTAPNLTYTPDPGFSGRDSFTYFATDASSENSNLAIVTLIVNGNADFIVADPAAVLGATGVYPGDETVYAEIQALGFTVNLVDDNDVAGAVYTSADADLVDLLIVSSSSGSGNIGSAFQNSTTPVMIWERFLYDIASGFGMTGITDTDDGIVNTTQINIVDGAHPLAGGLVNGTYTVFGAPENLVWGEVSPAAEVIAEVEISPGVFKPVLFVYEAGDVMQGGITAPAKRVAYFLPDQGIGILTPDALTLLNGAINEALAR